MRAVVHLRINAQGEQQDVQNQLAQLRQYAASQHWEIAGECVNHESGNGADHSPILGTTVKQHRAEVCEHVCARLSRALARATRSGRPVGRPHAIFDRDDVIEARRAGLSWRQIARKQGVGVTTIRRACCLVSARVQTQG
jgi:DNA invertase Pin-like site-specific DNA recombinase